MIVRVADAKWINNIGVYFEILREVNNDIIDLLKLNPKYNSKIEVKFFDVVVNLNRLIPIRHRVLDHSEGILKLEDSIDFLKNDYKEIFFLYKKEIRIITDMRDKFEHDPHTIKWKEYIGDDKYKKMIFINEEYNEAIINGDKKIIEIKEKNNEYLNWTIDTDMLIKIIVLLNKTFLKIQTKLKEYFSYDVSALNHPYIKNILEMDLEKYIDILSK